MIVRFTNRCSTPLPTSVSGTGGSGGGGSLPEAFGFELEDGTGFLEAEDNDDLEQEEAP